MPRRSRRPVSPAPSPAAAPRALVALLTATVLAAPLHAQAGDGKDPPGTVQKDLPPDLVVPAAPALSPAEALAAFETAGDLVVELVAAEPLIHDPVQARFDGEGRLWVAEMTGYMPDAEGTDEDAPIGSIAVLHDDDGDGIMDRRTTFLDELVLPRGILPIRDGALVIAPPEVLFCRDTDGDGRADERIVLESGVGGIPSPEHALNGLVATLDNRVAVANHPRAYRWVNGAWETEPGAHAGQWGQAQDDLGRLWFNTNSDVLRAHALPPRYAARNPSHGGIAGHNQRVVDDQRVWPVRITPGVNRGYQSGLLKDWKLTRTTAACGPLVHRGDGLPPSYRGDAFVCEPSANIVQHYDLWEDPRGAPRGRPATPGRAVLASHDERFRPVDLIDGPDGAVYVVDMYRGILQHRIFMTTFLRRQVDRRGLATPLGKGRIYRLRARRAGEAAGPRLASAEEFAAAVGEGAEEGGEGAAASVAGGATAGVNGDAVGGAGGAAGTNGAATGAVDAQTTSRGVMARAGSDGDTAGVVDAPRSTHGVTTGDANAGGAHVAPAPLSALSPVQVVARLAHANGFWRDQAQQALVQRRVDGPGVDEALRTLARTSPSGHGRAHALWTLDGRGGLDATTLEQALDAPFEATRRAAAACAERWILRQPARFVPRVLDLTRDASHLVAQQALLSLGVEHPRVLPALVRAACDDVSDGLRRSAILSGVPRREVELAAGLLADGGFAAPSDHRAHFLRLVARAVGREGRSARVLELLDVAGAGGLAWQREALLRGLLQAREDADERLPVSAEPPALAGLLADDDPAVVAAAEELFAALDWPGHPSPAVTVPVTPLTADEQRLFDHGAALYTAVCVACHQTSGRGLAGTAPPLRRSEHVLADDPGRLAAILIHGLTGPLTVRGQQWTGDMPALAGGDEDLAAVLTYIRREWGHRADPVSPEQVAATREQTATRDEPWTWEALQGVLED